MSKMIEAINKVLRVVTGALIGIMSLIVFANVLSRYVLHFSLIWSAELAEYCMVWAAFLGAAVLVSKGEHLVVDLLERNIKGMIRKALQIMVLFVSIVFFAAVTIFGTQLVIKTRGQVASSMRFLPMNLVYLIIPLSGILMIIGTVHQFLLILHNRRVDK